MEVTWLGHASFRLKGRDITLITDPIALKGPARSAAIVTLSHDHPRHNQVGAVEGVSKVVRGPGEYEIGRVFILGLPTFHDAQGGQVRGKNTIYRIEMDDLALCHLGDLGHQLSTALVEELGPVDVLFIPVGGVSTIDAAQATEVISLIEPRLVIPMHYRTPATGQELEPVERFLREMGLGEVEPQPRLNITRTLLAQETQVVLLSPFASPSLRSRA